MKINKRELITIIIPLVIACIVMVAMGVSGHITKGRDVTNPLIITTERTTKEKKVTVPSDSKATIIAVGDNTIGTNAIASGTDTDGSMNFSHLYENISQYAKDADLASINQDTVLGGDTFEYTGYPTYNTPWEVGTAEINAGFNVFSCATNNSLDVDKDKGINKELEFFSKHKNVSAIGINANQNDYNEICYVEKKDIKFALLNYTYGTNGIEMPDDKPWLVNTVEKSKITSDVKKAKKNADVVIVYVHWGTENSTSVSKYQEQYTKLFSDLGVDIVIGTHPHVLQKVEWVTNKTTKKKTLVYYSIGNFIGDQNSENQLLGGMAEITVSRAKGEVHIEDAKLAPTITHIEQSSTGYSYTTYKLSDYSEELAKKNVMLNSSYAELKAKAIKSINGNFIDL